MNFEVSVIIPVYNAAAYLEKSVLSAVNLAEVKEVLLIEDGSKDNSLEICKKLELQYEKVKLFQHPNGINKGAGATRNVGLKNVNFEFIAFLDADDFYLPHRFVKAKEILLNNLEVEGVFEAIGTYFYSEKAKEIYSKGLLTTLNEEFFAENGYFTTLVCGRGFTSLDGITLRKSILTKELRFDEMLKQTQDTDFIFNLALNCTMAAGDLKMPVTVRGVHETNRIHNISEGNFYANILAEKWIRKAKNSDWSDRIIHNLVMMYLVTSSKSKLFAMILLVAKYPFLILKFNPLDFIKRLK